MTNVVEECKCPRDDLAISMGTVCPNTRRHILGVADAGWLYLTQHKIQHHNQYPQDKDWLDRYTNLYNRVKAVCPDALVGILSPASVNPKPVSSPQPPSVISPARHLKFLPIEMKVDSKKDQDQQYLLAVVTETLPVTAMTIEQGLFCVVNSCGEACAPQDHIIVVRDAEGGKAQLQRIPIDGSITKPAQLFKVLNVDELKDFCAGFIASKTNNKCLVRNGQSTMRGAVVWHLGTVEEAAKDGEEMWLDMCMYSMA